MGDGGVIRHTVDGGVSWTAQTSGVAPGITLIGVAAIVPEPASACVVAVATMVILLGRRRPGFIA